MQHSELQAMSDAGPMLQAANQARFDSWRAAIKTNGKAECFIQTELREWAYAQAYPTSDRRAARIAV